MTTLEKKLVIVVLLIMTGSCKTVTLKHVNVSKETNATCPTWTYLQDNKCTCGNYMHEIVACESTTKQVQVQKCYCMTYSKITNSVVLASCRYNCGINSSITTFYKVCADTKGLNNKTCGLYNRQEQLCSQCLPGYGIAAYSYNSYCTECLDYRYNWMKYMAVAFVPLTAMYLIVLVINLDTTQPVLSSYILFSQIVTAPIIATLTEFSNKTSYIWHALITIYGMWNLDFFRSIYKPFCLHDKLSAHEVVALDYLIAIYPLFLILLTYLLVKLHDNYRLVVLIWKPFHCCVRMIRKEWNIKASLIKVFATFLLLSNVKLLNVSFDLISVPVTLWTPTGQSLPKKYTYLNGSMEYLGKEHLPYFVLGIAVLLVFNLLPILLLCLYPFRCFQRCLNRCSLSSPSLHIFMDAFQGCYRTAPRDYRSLSALNLVFRLINFFLFYFTINLSYFTLLSIAAAFMSSTVMVIHPYRSRQQTHCEGLTYLVLALLASLMNTSKVVVHANEGYKYTYFFLKSTLAEFPFIMMVLWVVYTLISKSKLKKILIAPFLKWLQRDYQNYLEDTPLIVAVSK